MWILVPFIIFRQFKLSFYLKVRNWEKIIFVNVLIGE